MSWSEATAKYRDSFSSERTRVLCGAAFAEFAASYRGAYGEEPAFSSLAAVEVLEWRGYLSNVRRLTASSVNHRLSALKGLLRANDGPYFLLYPLSFMLCAASFKRAVRDIVRRTI